MKAPKLCAAIVALCLASACSDSDPDAAFYEARSCPKPNIAGFPELDFPANAECGYLSVLEDRSKPEGRRIRILVTRAPAVSATPRPDPIVYLSGGPGGAGSFEVAFMVRHGLNAERDVIFVDQRGTHHADPLLSCPEFEQYLYDAVSVPFAAASTAAVSAAAVKACRDRLAATGVDLAGYNSMENAADIAELRRALGIDRWNVYGVSYGSKLALTVLRDHPQGIRSVVLDSVSPPKNNIAETWWSAPASMFKAVFATCAAQPGCAAAYPTLQADFTTTVNRLDATPAVTQLSDLSGAPLTVTVDGFAFVYTLITASEHGDVANIPRMMDEMARGEIASVAAAYLASRGPPQLIGLGGLALAFTVFCAEHANLTTEAAMLAKAKAVLPGFPERVLRVQPKQGRLFTECPIWNVGKADPAVSAPTVSDVPVLILEGSFDAATAPEWVDLVTPDLKRLQQVSFPFTGHGVLGKSRCAPSIMAAFLDDPMRPVDASCAAQTMVTFSD